VWQANGGKLQLCHKFSLASGATNACYIGHGVSSENRFAIGCDNGRWRSLYWNLFSHVTPFTRHTSHVTRLPQRVHNRRRGQKKRSIFSRYGAAMHPPTLPHPPPPSLHSLKMLLLRVSCGRAAALSDARPATAARPNSSALGATCHWQFSTCCRTTECHLSPKACVLEQTSDLETFCLLSLSGFPAWWLRRANPCCAFSMSASKKAKIM
jgi:hypothetical protein